MIANPAPIEALKDALQDDATNKAFAKDPIPVLLGCGFDLSGLNDQQKEDLATVVKGSSGDLEFNWKCNWCRGWVGTSIVVAEGLAIGALIGLIIILIGGSEGADEAAAEIAIEMDEAGIVNFGEELAAAERGSVEAAARVYGIEYEMMARILVRAFRIGSKVMLGGGFTRYMVRSVILAFDAALTQYICEARGDCKG